MIVRITQSVLALGLALAPLSVAAGGIVTPPVAPPIDPGPAVVVPSWAGGYVGGTIGFAGFRGTFCRGDAPGNPGPLPGPSFASGPSASTFAIVAFALPPEDEPPPPVSALPGDSSVCDQTPEVDGTGIMAGVTGGYDWQNGNLVFGVAADVMLGDVVNTGGGSFNCGTGDCELTATGVAMLRGRVGYALSDRVMPYVTAGVAFTQVDVAFTDGPSETDTATNLVVGLGADFRVTDRVSLAVDYLSLIENDQILGEGLGGAPDNGAYEFSGDMLRLTALFRF